MEWQEKINVGFVYAFMFGLVLRLSEVFQKPGFIMNYERGVNGQSTQNLFTFNDIPLLLFFFSWGAREHFLKQLRDARLVNWFREMH